MKTRLLLFIGLLINGLAFGQVPTTNLAGEYKFTNGTLTDAIGSNDLTQTGSALTLVDNRANGASKAVDLNGDYLQRAAFTNIQHLSISYWIKTTTNDATIKTIIDHSARTTDANLQSQYGWYTFLQNGKMGVAANFYYKYTNAGIQEGNNGYASTISTTNVADGAWHHVAISLQKRIYYWQNVQWVFENTYKVYIDGVLEATVSPYKYSGVGSSQLSSNMFPGNSATIGNISNGNSGSYYSEIIDDIRFYENHLFTPAEVTSLNNEVACSDGTGVTAISQNITRQLDATGNIEISADEIDNGSNADCDAAFSLAIDKSSFSCADLGANIVTLTATEISGAQASTTAVVTILPRVITQDITVQLDETGNATVSAEDVDNDSAGNCNASFTYSLDVSAFICDDLGPNTVTLSVDDGNGNVGMGTAIVTVTMAINNEAVTLSGTNLCPDGNSSATISTVTSLVGYNYSLQKTEDNSLVDGPLAGNGGVLGFSTGNVSETTTYVVVGEKVRATTQSALDFDGVNDYVTLGTDNRGVSTQVTAAAWIKTTGSGVAQIIVNKYNGINGYHIIIDPDGYAYVGGRDGAGYKQSGNSTTAVNDGEWHYIATSINISTGVWSIYVNGILENSGSNGAGTTLASTANLAIGAYSSLYFTGEMDQLTLWDTALDAAAIITNMNSCLSGIETNVVGHYIFEDGSGTVLTDQSSSSINGTLTNMDGATDWVQVVSPSCGEKVCDIQRSTEVTVGDNTLPNVIAQDVTLQLDGSGNATLTTADVNNGSSDNCTSVGNLVLSLDKSSFSCDDIGANSVVLTVADESGNESTANATVTVTTMIDDETVTASATNICTGGGSVNVNTASSVVGVNYLLRNNSNNAIIAGPIAGSGSGLTFNSGNLTQTTTFNVYGEFAVPSPHSALDFDGIDDKVVTSYIPPVTNELTVELWMLPRSAGFSRIISSYQGSSVVLAGEIVLDTYDATFNNGKALRFIVSGAGNVTQIFSVPNVLTLNAWNHVAATFNSGVIKIYVDGVLKGTSGLAPFSSLPTSASTVTIGEDRVQGPAAEYFNGQMDEIRIWNTAREESDFIAAMNSCLTGTESGLELYYKFNENTGLTTIDLKGNNNGTLTNMDAGSDWVSSGVSMLCEQTCGLEMTNTVTVTVGDAVNPTAIAQNFTVQLDGDGLASITTSDINNNSFDNCTATGSLVLNLDKTAFTCADLGANTVTLTVEDASGNQSTATATVTVADGIAPTATTQDITINLDATGNAAITTNDITMSTSDNCTASGNIVLSLDQTTFMCTNLGATTVTLTAEDASGNQGTATATVTVVDNIAPTAAAQNITVQLDASGSATIVGADIDNASSDNCSSAPLVFTLDKTTFSCAGLGTNTVLLTVKDASGNSSSTSATVTIEDNLAPTAIARDITLNLDNSGNATLTASQIDNGSTDNCTATENLVRSIDVTSFTSANLGANTVTLTVQDASGNSSTATSTVTVENKTNQTISFGALADATYGDADITLAATADSGLPVSFTLISGPATLSGTTLSITGVGTVVVEASQDGDASFGVASIVQQTFNVNLATLTVTADDQTIIYGDAIPTLTFAYSGFVNNEDVTALAAEPSISTTATAASDAGSYAITLTGGSGTNYNISLVNGTLTINKADQSITLDAIADQDITSVTQVSATASASSGLASTLSVTGPATISGNTITLDGTVGPVTITASQAGNVNYNAATDVSVSFQAFDSSDPCLGFAVALTTTTNNACNGAADGAIDITVTGGDGNYTYAWSNSTATEDATGLVAGTYTVTITDGNSCSVSLTETITEPTLIEVIASTTDVVAGNDGAADITVTGGTGAYTFSWSNGADTEDLANVAAGTYTVTVTDENGCSVSQTVEVGDIITGVEDVEATMMQVYPNPVSDYLSLEDDFTGGKVEIQLVNILGVRVLTQQFENVASKSIELSVTNLKAGQYLVLISTNNKQTLQRITIKH
jgi:concanavalin A-like lectin/glucanase superfamily protein/MBG domain-containing protein/type IX secretion system substrate protein/SprB-like repeat protein